MNKRITWLILPLVLFSHLVWAGTIVLTNGDKLTGTVTVQTAVQRVTVKANNNKEETDGSTTKKQYLPGGKYDRFFSEKWYGFVGLDFEKDKFKDLELPVEAGLGYTDDDFINADDDTYMSFVWGVNRDGDPAQSTKSTKSTNHTYKLRDWLRLVSRA